MMYTIVDNLYQNIPHKNILQRDGDAVKLVRWHASSDESRPALVFVPGFLTQQSPTKDLEVWTPKIKAIAKHYDFDAWGLYWPSENLESLLDSGNMSNFLSATMTLQTLPMGLALLPTFALSPAIGLSLGIGSGLVDAALKTWKRAVRRADDIAMNPSWLNGIDRPIILIGHSLGGRIAIQSTAHSHSSNANILSTFALAPAVLESECNMKQFHRNQEFKGTICHSINDLILEYAFRFGELTEELPLGFSGLSNHNRSYAYSQDCSFINHHTTRHDTYQTYIDDLFINQRLRHLLLNL